MSNYNNLTELIRSIKTINSISYDNITKTFNLHTNIELSSLSELNVNELVFVLEENEIFNGNGYTIYLNNITTKGIFKSNSTNNKVIIKNLSLENGIIDVSGSSFMNNMQSNYHIINCSVKSTLVNENSSGFSGYNNNNFIIEKCISNIIINNNNCGGFVGLSSNNFNINECIFNGTIIGNNNGGFIGPSNNNGLITSSISIVDINYDNSGFVGFINDTINNTINIERSYHIGNGNNLGYVIQNNVYNNDSIEISNLNDKFIEDNYDYQSYPLLKCFRQLPWKKDEYENYNNIPRLGSTIKDFTSSGYIESELKDYGFSIEEFRQENYTITELVELGFKLKDIMNAGYTTVELISEGYTMAMVLEDVINIDDITYGDDNVKVISKELIDNKIVYTLLQNISWREINEITENADFFTLKKNEVFDGNNFLIDLSGVSTRGLFKTESTNIEDAPIIRNLNIINGNVSSNDFYDQGNSIIIQKEQKYFILDNCNLTTNIYGEFNGGLCGMYSGFEGGHCIIRNCNFQGNIFGNHSGGIVGSGAGNSNGKCEIINCNYRGIIEGKGSGGIAGFACGNGSGNCIIDKCNSFDIVINGECAGGIIGSHAGNRGNCHIINCDSSGVINGNWSGGISGFNSGYKGVCNIEKCSYNGILKGEYNGGITGLNGGYMGLLNIKLCRVFDITIEGRGSGGIIGGNAGVSGVCNIDKCYSIDGNIQSNESGGIAGSYSGKLDGSFNITNSYSLLNIDGSGNGGICGAYSGNQGNTNIKTCYYNGIIRGINNGGICGAYTGTRGNVIIENSYSSGNIGNNNNGLCSSYCGSSNGSCKIYECFSLSNQIFIGVNSGVDNGFIIIQNSYTNGVFIDIVSDNSKIIIQNSFSNQLINEGQIIESNNQLINDISLTILNNESIHNNIINNGNSFVERNGEILLDSFLQVPWIKNEYTSTSGPTLGILVTDLSNAGYSIDELHDYGFTGTEIAKIGYPIRELLSIGGYVDNELLIEDYLNEVIDLSSETIREDFMIYGDKFSLTPLVDNTLISLFINKMVYTTQSQENIDSILFVLTDKISITQEIRNYLNNNGYLYIESNMGSNVSLNVGVIQNMIESVGPNDNTIHQHIKYNGGYYVLDNIINMNSLTFYFYGVGNDNNYGSFLLRGELYGSSSGDPHIYPLIGSDKYELPNKETNYRMLQSITDDLIINCSTRNIRSREKEDIKVFYKYKTGEDAPEDLQVDGVFYKEVFINSDNNKLYYNFDTMELKISGNKNYYKYNVKERNGRNEKEFECCDKIIGLNIVFNHSYYGLIKLELNYLSNPQLKYGIRIHVEERNNLHELSGLLIKEYNCEYFEVNKLKNKYFKSINNNKSKQKNKKLSYHMVY
jgi:hypothetical protein